VFDVAGVAGEVDSAQQMIRFVPRKPRQTPLAPRLSDAEEAAHAAFIATLGAQALWLKLAP
jgi:hypothetical protein